METKNVFISIIDKKIVYAVSVTIEAGAAIRADEIGPTTRTTHRKEVSDAVCRAVSGLHSVVRDFPRASLVEIPGGEFAVVLDQIAIPVSLSFDVRVALGKNYILQKI